MSVLSVYFIGDVVDGAPAAPYVQFSEDGKPVYQSTRVRLDGKLYVGSASWQAFTTNDGADTLRGGDDYMLVRGFQVNAYLRADDETTLVWHTMRGLLAGSKVVMLLDVQVATSGKVEGRLTHQVREIKVLSKPDRSAASARRSLDSLDVPF